MKFIYLFVVILSANLCFGQNVKFQLYNVRSCNTVEEQEFIYFMMEVGGNTRFGPSLSDTAIVKLPHIGKYKIYFNRHLIDTPVVNITDTGLTIYRYKEPNIIMNCCAMHSPPVYTSCDKLADGFLEDFYPDGHIRQRGDFWKGRIKDTLVQYYHNGKISIRIRESKEKVDVEEFDSLGCRRRKAGYVNPDGMYFEGNDTTLYFPNGKLQINKMITAEGYIFIDEYYPNGKLKAIQGKNSRIEYFNSGEKNAEYSWLEDPDYRGYFDIVKKIYDKKQRKLREIKYVFSNFGHWEFDYHLSQSRFIESDVRYKNGKQISLVKDLYMDKAENKLRYRNE